MANSYLDILPQNFSDNSRVWIYQSSRPFSQQEELEINEQLHNFYIQWMSHGAPVKGWAMLLFKQLVVVVADEENVGVGGCSTDSMVRVMKSFERQYQVQLFERHTFLFLVKDKPQALPMQQIAYALEKGFISPNTPLFNNLVENFGKLKTEWLVPLRNSWLWQRLQLDAIKLNENEHFSTN